MWDRTTAVVPSPNSRPSSLTPSADAKETGREVDRSARGPSAPHAIIATPTARTMRRIPVGTVARTIGPLAALLAALPAGLLQQLLVLLLPHLLAALLDKGWHASFSYSDPNKVRRSTRFARKDASRRTEPSLSAFGPSATGEMSRSTPSSVACSRYPMPV